VAVSFAAPPTCTVATAVESETLMGGVGLTEGACAPPPQPERAKPTSAKASPQKTSRCNELAIAKPPSPIAVMQGKLLGFIVVLCSFTSTLIFV
jgi:hypothetical protein